MALLDDILKALDRVELWRRLKAIPDRTDELEKRVAELETKLGGKWPADVCRKCGERALRLTASRPGADKGIAIEFWTCGSCNEEDRRFIRAK